MRSQQATKDPEGLQLDSQIRFRIPQELKRRFSAIARRKVKTDAELAREVFCTFVNQHSDKEPEVQS